MFQKADMIVTPLGAWLDGRRLACTWGRGGVVDRDAKREGDGATPRGLLRVTGLLYRPDRMAPPAPWARPIRPGDLWSDDPRDPAYNHGLRAPHGFSHEVLRRADPLYDLVLTTNWNWPRAIPGRGSAIFLHRWRRICAPTAGCIAFAPQDLAHIAARLAPGALIAVR